MVWAMRHQTGWQRDLEGRSHPEARPLLSSVETWSSQLIKCVLPSRAEGEGAAGSWRGAILWESLPVMILKAVGVLGPELTSSSSLSSFSEEEKSSGDAFLETSAAKTLLEEHLTIRQAREHPLGWTHLPALEPAQEIRLSESGDLPTLVGVAWGPGGQALVADDLFWIFDLTMVVVRGKEGMCMATSFGKYYLQYCKLSQLLFPNVSFCPNHHYAMHIPDLL